MDDVNILALMEQLLNMVLGFIPEGVREPIVSSVSALVYRLSGGDKALDATIASDKTNTGIAQSARMRATNQLSQRISDDYRDKRMRESLSGIYQTLYPPSSVPANVEYNEYITDKVNGAMTNGLTQMALKFVMDTIGWDDAAATSRALGTTASNIAVQGMRAGRMLSFLADARQMTEQLLTSDNGKFNRNEWGGFESSAVAALASDLSGTSDVFAGYDLAGVDRVGQLNAAANQFRERVRRFLNALQPLRDVFGQDMNAIISSVESLSGQTLETMGPTRIAELASDIRTTMSSGRYGFNEWQQGVPAMKSGILAISPNAQPWVRSTQSATRYTAVASDIAHGGYQPTWEDDAEWGAVAANVTADVASSPGTDLLAKLYSIWRHDREMSADLQPDEDLSFGGFRALVEYRVQEAAAKGKPLDVRRAAMEVANVNSTMEADRGLGYVGYAQALREGSAMMLSRQSHGGELRSLLGAYMSVDTPGYWRSTGVNSYEDAMRLFNRTADLFDKNINIDRYITENDEEFINYVNENLRKEDGTQYSREEALQMLTSLRYIVNDPRGLGRNWIEIRKMAQTDAEETDRRNREAARSAMLESLPGVMTKTGGWAQLIDAVLDKNTGEVDFGKLAEKFQAYGVIKAADKLPEDVQAIVGGAMMAAEQVAEFADLDPNNPDQKDAIAKRDAYIERIINYTESTQGLMNKGAIESLENIKQATRNIEIARLRETVDETEVERYRNVMRLNAVKLAMYAHADQGLVDDFFNTEHDIYDSVNGRWVKALTKDSTQAEIDNYNRVLLENANSFIERQSGQLMDYGSGIKGPMPMSDALRWELLDTKVKKLETADLGESERDQAAATQEHLNEYLVKYKGQSAPYPERGFGEGFNKFYKEENEALDAEAKEGGADEEKIKHKRQALEELRMEVEAIAKMTVGGVPGVQADRAGMSPAVVKILEALKTAIDQLNLWLRTT